MVATLSMLHPVDQFRAYLASRDLKYTRQRKVIAQVFFRSAEHLSLRQVLALARAEYASIGYATVYRTMKLLADSGLASERKFAEDHSRYEPAVDGQHHDHLICVDCGHIIEYEDLEIEARQHAIADEHGFLVVEHRHEIYGRCVVVDCPRRKPHG